MNSHRRRELKRARRAHRLATGRRNVADVHLTEHQRMVRDLITYRLFQGRIATQIARVSAKGQAA